MAVLESGPLVHKVQVRLNDSCGPIHDLDETLAIFDLKIRHMREDIAAKEARNNRATWTAWLILLTTLAGSKLAVPPGLLLLSSAPSCRSATQL
ncbi:hypothetical protein WJX77_007183 [Trebouxia sp. C0004]